MKDKIISHLGADQAARLEAKAKLRGIEDIYEVAIERATAELGPEAKEEAIVERAAVRAQQRAGVLSRFRKRLQASSVEGASVEGQAEETAAPAAEDPALPEGPAKRSGKSKKTEA